MSKVPLVATAAQLYNGLPLKPGETFDANSENDADELCTIGFATRAPGHDTRAVTAEQPALQAPTARRAYKRRDMRAAK